MKRLALHWWILIAMGLGIGAGLLASETGTTEFVLTWISPIGTPVAMCTRRPNT